VFLPTMVGKSPSLSSGFALWTGSDTISGPQLGAAVLLTMATVLDATRSANSKTLATTLGKSQFQQALLDPENFTRYNDGVIQAAMLRAAYTPKLDWRGRPRNATCRLIRKDRKGACAPESALIVGLEQLVASGSVTCVQEAADALDISVKFLHKIAPSQAARLVETGRKRQKCAVAANGDAKFKEFLRSHEELRTTGT
jgi:hypothetical protein